MDINDSMFRFLMANAVRDISLLPRQMSNIKDFAQELYGIPRYPENISIEEYRYLFKKNALAKRIISMYPSECWRTLPAVTEGEAPKETEFEKQWTALASHPKLKLLKWLKTVDIISGIGRFGILFLGLSDGKTLDKPMSGSADLLFLRAFDETCVRILEWETNPSNERYGHPTLYSIKFDTEKSHETRVHWTRCIHIAEDAIDSPVYGEPRLESVIEPVLDVSLILRGSPHMFMRGGFPGYSFEAEPDVQITEADKEKMKEQIQDYIQSMTRFLTLQGVKANSLSVQLANPDPYIKSQIAMISASTGIPSRMLMGSEMGHLASTADKMTFEDRIHDRQESHLTPEILLPLARRLQIFGILPETNDDIIVTWLKVDSTSQKERAEVSKLKSEALARYASTPMAPAVVPEEHFLRYILGFSPGEVSQILGGETNLPLGDINAETTQEI